MSSPLLLLEVVVQVMRYLNPMQRIRVSRVCKVWQEAADDPIFWKELRFASLPNSKVIGHEIILHLSAKAKDRAHLVLSIDISSIPCFQDSELGDAIIRCRALKYLKVRNTAAGSITMKNLPNTIEVLDIYGCFEASKVGLVLPHLRTLISGCAERDFERWMNHPGPKTLIESLAKNSPALQEASFGLAWNLEDPMVLLKLAENCRLRKADILYCPSLSDEFLRRLSGIQYLNIRCGGGITDEGLCDLAGSGLLRGINVSCIRTITSKGIRQIISRSPNLSELDCCYCENVAAEVLMAACRPNLTKLGASGITGVTDAMVDSWIKAAPNLKLLGIGGKDHPVTQKSIISCAKLSKLKSLVIHGIQVSRSIIEDLLHRCPHLSYIDSLMDIARSQPNPDCWLRELSEKFPYLQKD
eukprot:UC4_evm5s1315